MRLRRPSAWQVLTSLTAVLVLCCGVLVVSLHADRSEVRDTPVDPLIDVLTHAAQDAAAPAEAQADLDRTARLLVASGAAQSVELRSASGAVLMDDHGDTPRRGVIEDTPVTLPVRWSTGRVSATLVLTQPASAAVVRHEADLLQGLALLLLAVMTSGLVVIRRQHTGQVRVSLMDPLTGVGNRRQLQRAAERSLRAGSGAHGLLVLDLDGFKELNDSRGHAAGDRTLVRVAEALQAATRPTDQVVRLGGDEFAVLVDDLPDGRTDASLHAVLDRVRAVVPEVGISGGTAVWPLDGRDLGALLTVADAAMYADKRARRSGSPVRSRV